MERKGLFSRTSFRTGAIFVVFLVMIGLIVTRTGIFWGDRTDGEGLSDIVAVKGTVKVDDLHLSEVEVSRLNRAVEGHKGTFAQVDLFLDVKAGAKDIAPETVLIWAMVLKADGECEVRSWSRKVARSDLVPQMILYMNKAAREYGEFQKHPDVRQSFKCLYI
ncbi:MAG: hypothetical protein V3571_05670 [Pseudodesulfovibrio sp.]